MNVIEQMVQLMVIQLGPNLRAEDASEAVITKLVKNSRGRIQREDIEILSPLLAHNEYHQAYQHLEALARQEKFGFVILDPINAVIRTFKDLLVIDRCVRLVKLSPDKLQETAHAIKESQKEDSAGEDKEASVSN